MKINKKWLITFISNILLFIGATLLSSSYIYYGALINSTTSRILISLCCLILILYILIDDFYNGESFYDYVILPLKKLNHTYKNEKLIIIYEEKIFEFKKKKQDFEKIHSMKIIKFYNFKKMLMSWVFVPLIK